MSYSQLLDIRGDKGQEIQYQNLNAVIGTEFCEQLKALKRVMGVDIRVLGGQGGSGLLMHSCLPAFQRPGLKMAYVDTDEDGAQFMRDWLKTYRLDVVVCSSITNIPSETEQLIYRFDIGTKAVLSQRDLNWMESLNQLRVITLIPPIDRWAGGIEVPEWINSCTWLRGCRLSEDRIDWTLVASDSATTEIDRRTIGQFETTAG